MNAVEIEEVVAKLAEHETLARLYIGRRSWNDTGHLETLSEF